MSVLGGPETAGTDPDDLPLPSGATRSGTSVEEELEDSILDGQVRRNLSQVRNTQRLLRIQPYDGENTKFQFWRSSFTVAVMVLSRVV